MKQQMFDNSHSYTDQPGSQVVREHAYGSTEAKPLRNDASSHLSTENYQSNAVLPPVKEYQGDGQPPVQVLSTNKAFETFMSKGDQDDPGNQSKASSTRHKMASIDSNNSKHSNSKVKAQSKPEQLTNA